MEELTQELKVCLASVFSLYLKAHNFHWNVEGPFFSQYHELFKTIYEDVWDSVDAIAEHLRTLGAYAPGSLSRFSELTVVSDQINIPSANKMIQELLQDNENVKQQLIKAFRLAESNNPGVSNFLQGRIEMHEKHSWMLRATGK